MRNAVLVKSRNGTLCHTVVLSIDYVEIFAAVDNGFNDLLRFCFIPSCRLLNNLLHLAGSKLCIKSTGTSNLSVGTHSALNVDYVVFRKILRKKPVHCGLAFLRHIGNNGCLVKALVNGDLTVKDVYLNAGILCLLENIVPTGRLSCGDQEVINAVRDESLRCLKLLVVNLAVEGLELVSVLSRENSLNVLYICFAVAGLGRRVVYNADLNLSVFLVFLAASSCHAADNKDCHQ